MILMDDLQTSQQQKHQQHQNSLRIKPRYLFMCHVTSLSIFCNKKKIFYLRRELLINPPTNWTNNCSRHIPFFILDNNKNKNKFFHLKTISFIFFVVIKYIFRSSTPSNYQFNTINYYFYCYAADTTLCAINIIIFLFLYKLLSSFSSSFHFKIHRWRERAREWEREWE